MIISLPPHVCACIETLEQAGYEAWAVGGCVRDLLRGIALSGVNAILS